MCLFLHNLVFACARSDVLLSAIGYPPFPNSQVKVDERGCVFRVGPQVLARSSGNWDAVITRQKDRPEEMEERRMGQKLHETV